MILIEADDHVHPGDESVVCRRMLRFFLTMLAAKPNILMCCGGPTIRCMELLMYTVFMEYAFLCGDTRTGEC